MSTTVTNANKVNAVLIPSVSTLLEKDKRTFDLKPGQLGIFDAASGKSVDKSNAAASKTVDIALGYDIDPQAASSSRIIRGAGSISRDATLVTKSYIAAVPEVYEITKFVAESDQEYVIRLNILNSNIKLMYQGQRKIVSFSYSTNDFKGATDTNEMVKALVSNINESIGEYVLAEAIDYSGASPVVVTDIDAFIVANKAVNLDIDITNDVCLGIRLTGKILPKDMFVTPTNPNYKGMRNTYLDVAMEGRFVYPPKIEKTTSSVVEQGSGYDIKFEEYTAQGYMNGLLFVGDSIPGTTSEQFEFFSQVNTNYDQLSVVSSIESKDAVGGIFVNSFITNVYFDTTKTSKTLFDAIKEVLTPVGVSILS